jgi:hypothetical protein
MKAYPIQILPPHCRAKCLTRLRSFPSQPDSLECSPVSCSCFTLTNYTLVYDSTLPHVVAWIHCWAEESAFVIRWGLLSQVGRRAACQLLNFHRWQPRAPDSQRLTRACQSKITTAFKSRPNTLREPGSHISSRNLLSEPTSKMAESFEAVRNGSSEMERM